MTVPKRFEPVRMPCAHYPDFCPRNAVEGSDRCEQHQRIVAAAPPPPAAPAVPPGAVASPEAYALAAGIGDDDDDDLGQTLIGRRRHRHVAKPEPREALLPFFSRGGVMLYAEPQLPFAPRGLLLWNVEGLSLEASLVGNQLQLACDCRPVPAEWFATGKSYEEVVQAFMQGRGPGPGWGSWDVLRPGVRCSLRFDRNVDGSDGRVPVRALMWGHTP